MNGKGNGRGRLARLIGVLDKRSIKQTMAQRKYMSEFGVSMFGTLCVLLQQEQLDELSGDLFNEEEPCHIYMIGRRPRIALDPDSLLFTNQTIEGRFLLQHGNKFESHEFVTKHPFGTSNVKVDCKYPHSEFKFLDSSGKILLAGKSAVLMSKINSRFWPMLNLEVLYIGQSYGVDGARTAPQRLKEHSTLQSIYAEAIKNTPDQEIWLVLWAFEPMLAISIDGRSNQQFLTNDEEDDQHAEQVVRQLINEQQQINFTEAALIRYFQPEYNTIYRNSFPNPAHKTYSECYDIDLNSVGVEIHTEELGCQLWSSSADAKWQHLMFFPLHSREERIWMLDF